MSRRLAVATLLCLLPAVPASGNEQVRVERLGGADRYETAAIVARATFPPGPDRRYDVYVARGDVFPDALAASFVAGYYNGGGPLLLTPTHELHSATRAAIEDLAWRVAILGDEIAVSHRVEEEIRAIPSVEDVYRIAGPDRYWTARHIVGKAPQDHSTTGIVATGADFVDALVAGPLAYTLAMPLLLTTPDRLHEAARDGLEQESSISEVIVVGGRAAVSDVVVREIEAICRDDTGCITAERIGGATRTETATLLANEYLERLGELGQPVEHVNLARGDVFADAAAGAPHAGEEAELAPILLTRDPNTLSSDTRRWLEAHRETLESIHVFGTSDAVSDEVVDEARQAATSR
ncbi:MAG: cell wall-binding repeat-containing protein [Actinobacteria bacterium]|nr:cell wall-binding repeat-containing protein [Actinomycetota bacterium]